LETPGSGAANPCQVPALQGTVSADRNLPCPHARDERVVGSLGMRPAVPTPPPQRFPRASAGWEQEAAHAASSNLGGVSTNWAGW